MAPRANVARLPDVGVIGTIHRPEPLLPTQQDATAGYTPPPPPDKQNPTKLSLGPAGPPRRH